jgi:D-amino peptidase
MKVYIMTDLEGVAGVLNFQEWTGPGKPYYPVARELLTLEVNAAVDGFFEGGATEILVVDGHGPGAIDVKLLDPRADLLRGWGPGPWPLCLDQSFDALAFVGQHAKAATPYAHLCHTQSLGYLDLTINGISIGEFGQLAMCASELGVRTIFGSGDLAFTKEALALVFGIETVAVKRGMKPGTGDDLTEEEYARATASALHTHPVRARALIRAGALQAVERARRESFGLIPLQAPFERVIRLRPSADRPTKAISRVIHPTSVIGAMNAPDDWKPLEGE